MQHSSPSSLLARLVIVSLTLAAAGCEKAEQEEAVIEFVLPTEAEKASFEALTGSQLADAANLPLEKEAIYTFLEQILVMHPEVFGTAFALAPDYAKRQLSPYVYRGAAGLMRTDLSTGGYDYANQPWFTGPVESMAAVWSEPYFDAGGGNINMVTFSAPVTKDGRIIAVLTADFGPLTGTR